MTSSNEYWKSVVFKFVSEISQTVVFNVDGITCSVNVLDADYPLE